MHVSRDQRSRKIREVIDHSLRHLCFGRVRTEAFASYFNEPDGFYAQGWPDRSGDWPDLNDRSLLPLWQHEDKVYAIDIENVPYEFISFFVHCPGEPNVFSSIHEALFESIRLHVWEYGGDAEEVAEARTFADEIDLPHRAKFERLMDRWMECTGEEIREYCSDLARFRI